MKSLSMIKRIWWYVAFCLSVLALLHNRGRDDGSSWSVNWSSKQTLESMLAGLDDSPRYLCVGDRVFVLGENYEFDLEENSLILDRAEAAKKCSLPHFPRLDGAQAILISSAPSTGYGAALISFEKKESDAVETVNDGLELAGWTETERSRASRERFPPLKARLFERGDGWLFCATASNDSNRKTELLLAGRFETETKR